jgi:uncharacterized membrane protein YjjB (DUF3815 family)
MVFSLQEMIIQYGFGAVATFGFAILFNVPRHALVYDALIGGGAVAIRYILRTQGVSAEVATFLSALFIGMAGYWVAVRFDQPRILFTVPSMIPLVPGIPAYETLFHFSAGDVLAGLNSAVRATLITGAIALGLGVARIVVEREWMRVENK